MALAAADKQWFLDEIARVDPDGRVVVATAGGTRLVYDAVIRSDENRDRPADDEELVRALTLCLLCSPEYGYAPERMYLEQSHTIGRPSTSGAQVDIVLFYLEEDGSETVFAMWEVKAPDKYDAEMDAAIEHQLFKTAPLISPTLLVYSTIKPQKPAIECMTIDYTAHKTFAGWDRAGRPHT